MTLLTTVFAAVISTILWYKRLPDTSMNIGILCWMYWGASAMWFVDAIFEYSMLHAEYFAPSPLNMLNDLYLGLSAVALGLVIWLLILLVRDPKGVIKAQLLKKHNQK